MLPATLQSEIVDLVNAYWDEQTTESWFIQLARGKRFGHRAATIVEEQTVDLLREKLHARLEIDGRGETAARSMGDGWVGSVGGIFNPVNVKTGDADKHGRPNIVSITRLLSALLEHKIDAYYLLLVKFHLSAPTVDVEMVDLLDHLDYVSYNAGPGQLMLNEKEFRARVRACVPTPLSLDQKIYRLVTLADEAEARLARDRAARMVKLRSAFLSFDQAVPISQNGLRLA